MPSQCHSATRGPSLRRAKATLTSPESSSRVTLGIVEAEVAGRVDGLRGRAVVVGVPGRPAQERQVPPRHGHVQVGLVFHWDRGRHQVVGAAGLAWGVRGGGRGVVRRSWEIYSLFGFWSFAGCYFFSDTQNL